MPVTRKSRFGFLLPAVVLAGLVFVPSAPAVGAAAAVPLAEAVAGTSTQDDAVASDAVLYETQLKPILRERCYACHGALKQESGLRLDTVLSAAAGGESGPAIVAADADASLILQRVSSADESVRMPPEGEPLKPEQIDLLRTWIVRGAKAPAGEIPEEDPRDHWSFRPPVRPIPPQTAVADWNFNPIDQFLAAEHHSRGLRPQPEADRRVLLRRLYFDLIGLPPTLAEQEAFLADNSADAWEKTVDRLLNSPQYGERWGRHWMDVWRYSDWWGLGAEVRNSQKHIWHWRDWIIESLNADKGYDQMLREMLASDELYPNDPDRLRAGGFLARQYFKFNRTTWLDSTIEHTSKAMLGLTFNCCKCHDHKYDPMSHEDYYHLRAIFEPHQVRMDFVAGQLNPELDGIPRPFDCNAEAKTFVHRRGDDRHPDESHEIIPRVPDFLAAGNWSVQPVELPIDAWQPGLRPDVLETLLSQANKRIEDAQAAVAAATRRVAEFSKPAVTVTADSVTPVEPTKLVSDTFDQLDAEIWQPIGGDWRAVEGNLVQQRNDGSQALLRLKSDVPRDFEAVAGFTTTGGQKWKSVGIAFDVAESADVLAYVSAVEGGSKAQVAYKKGGQSVYPPEAAQSRSVPLNQPQRLTLRVRGQLINVLVNDELAVAFRLPIDRIDGGIQLVTFDATAMFSDFSLSALRDDVRLTESTGGAKSDATPETPASAQLALDVAVLELKTAALQPELLRARAAAMRAQATADTESSRHIVQKAFDLERDAAFARTQSIAARAELDLLLAPDAKKAELQQKLDAAQKAVAEARTKLDAPGTTFTPLEGALKTLESNLETEESRRRPFPSTSTGRRSAFAAWVTDSANPLPARVAVNHIWLRHMGRPLVATVFDFGRKGARPTHPQLLDWLAVELVESNWSMKHIHRLIVTSRAYRLSSSAADLSAGSPSGGFAESAGRDPENQFYWRANSTRMEAQAVRDSLLHLAGELDTTIGGPSIPVADEASRRRSLYFVHSHNEHQKFLSMFDDANVLDCYRRDQSIVPQQALALENSPLAAEMAAKIEQQIRMTLKSGEPSAEPQSDSTSETAAEELFVRRAFQTVMATDPDDVELQIAMEGLTQLRAAAAARSSGDPGRSGQTGSTSQAGSPADTESAGNPGTAARRLLIQTLLNHNDFVTIR